MRPPAVRRVDERHAAGMSQVQTTHPLCVDEPADERPRCLSSMPTAPWRCCGRPRASPSWAPHRCRWRPSNSVMRYLLGQGYECVPVTPNGREHPGATLLSHARGSRRRQRVRPSTSSTCSGGPSTRRTSPARRWRLAAARCGCSRASSAGSCAHRPRRRPGGGHGPLHRHRAPPSALTQRLGSLPRAPRADLTRAHTKVHLRPRRWSCSTLGARTRTMPTSSTSLPRKEPMRSNPMARIIIGAAALHAAGLERGLRAERHASTPSPSTVRRSQTSVRHQRTR